MSKITDGEKLLAEKNKKEAEQKPTISYYWKEKNNPAKKKMAAKTTAKNKKRTVAKKRTTAKNPAEPTDTQTEKVFTYWRKPKNFRSREWLEKELGQLRLFNYNTGKINYNPAQLRIETLPGGKFGVYLKSQLLRQSKVKSDMQSYLNALKNR